MTFQYYMDSSNSLQPDTDGSHTWYCVDVYGYDNQMVDANFTNANKRTIFSHEMGHALSLKHNDSMYPLLMNTDVLQPIKVIVPQYNDIQNIQLK